MGNIDIVPTLAKILGIEMPSTGTLKGRVLQEALVGGPTTKPEALKTLVSTPDSHGISTMLEYLEADGVRYYERACFVTKNTGNQCP